VIFSEYGLLKFLLLDKFKGVNKVKVVILEKLVVNEASYKSLSKMIYNSRSPNLKYHLNGSKDIIGLIDMGLVKKFKLRNDKGFYVYKITPLGRRVLKIVRNET
jgi:predicted transcriptional regulator with HTH domain